MPYIDPTYRPILDPTIDQLAALIQTFPPEARVGFANYAITRLLLKGIVGTQQDIKYTKINDVYGVIEGVKAEFSRAVAGPYEAQKSFENGSVDW